MKLEHLCLFTLILQECVSLSILLMYVVEQILSDYESIYSLILCFGPWLIRTSFPALWPCIFRPFWALSAQADGHHFQG